MSPSSSQYFFISYSREDAHLQRRIVAELRGRDINVWVDTENLIPGSPAWEREIERSIRGSEGLIVLLSPNSNNSEWVRREISFAEQNSKRIFPVLIHGDEDDSVPLRLSSHQRVDARKSIDRGMDELAHALKNYLGTTVVNRRFDQKRLNKSFTLDSANLKKFALSGLLILAGIACMGILFAAGRFLLNNIPITGTTTTPATETAIAEQHLTETATQAVINNKDKPTGKIIYTCSIQGDEVCIIKADGSGWQQLTDSQYASFNATLSPDGQKAVYVISNGKYSEIYELNMDTGVATPLTDLGKNLGSPEISPNNKYIIFHYKSSSDNVQLWYMKRDGSNPKELYSESGKDVHDGSWSPDGKQILFAMGLGDSNKLYTMDFNGHSPKLLNNSIDTRGRSDWSINNLIVLDMGGSWAHEVYTVNSDGSNLKQISPKGKNSQGASFSPDGKWIAFTAYTNVADKDLNSCEIFIMRIDGSDVHQLTNNNYCDYQPRWGN